MRRFRFLRRPQWLLTLIVAIALALQILVSAQAAPLPTTPAIASARSASLIPIQQQPFYGELERTAGDWSDVVLDQVVGNSPRETLLNFYAVMAEVGQRAERLAQPRSGQEGSRAAKERQEKIEDADLLFHLAVEALDASAFPESVRVDRAEEAAIQLKHVLDYVFTHSRQPIAIPDEANMKMLQESRTNQSDSWSIPGTSITLTSPSDSELGSDHYRFSPATVVAVGEMYREIRDYPVIPQPFATPEFLNNFIFTPGYLVPPDWYLSLPHSLRHVLGYRIGNQTLLQVVSSLIACALFVAVLGWLIGLLVDSYRDRPRREQEGRSWQLDVLAWQRVLILLPLLPLTRLVKTFVDDVVNLTGAPLVFVTYIFFVIWYVSAGFFAFYFAEAVGRSSAELLLRLRGGGSSLQLQRITNLVMPITRAIGALASIALLYRLLIVLGLPANTVLAFSAVPGLAIGLGASKLLGNLFAGLSIQTDRPLRVGEFCRVGDHLGYITKIGLRSLELQTLESRITVPNSVAEEATIENYSRRGIRGDQPPIQALELRLQLDGPFSPFQLEELLRQSRRFLAGMAELIDPLVTLERRPEDSARGLIVFAMVELHGWQAYLSLREQLLVHLEELVERAQFSEIALAIAYGTTPEQLLRIPALMQQVVEADPTLTFHSCRLERIAAFSYDHVIEFSSNQINHEAFEDSLHDLNRRIIDVLAMEGIEIPFPTQTLMLNSSDAAHA